MPFFVFSKTKSTEFYCQMLQQKPSVETPLSLPAGAGAGYGKKQETGISEKQTCF
jgi:hypothetical protein